MTVLIYSCLQRDDMARLVRWALGRPSHPPWRPALDPDVLKTAGIFGLQAFQKHFLAEGEKMVLVAVESSYNQGVYGLVNNLGSLVARLVFQPIEEAAFASFTTAATIPSVPPEPEKDERTHSETKPTAGAAPGPRSRGAATEKEAEAKGAAAAAAAPEANLGAEALSLIALTRVVLVLGLLGVTFGPPNARLVIHMLYSYAWSSGEAPGLLGHYCLYLLAMALNGVTEAFVHAGESDVSIDTRFRDLCSGKMPISLACVFKRERRWSCLSTSRIFLSLRIR